MDEKMAALMGATAAVVFAGRGLRPVAKLAVKGMVVASEAGMGAMRGIGELYAEVRAEQRADAAAQRATAGADVPTHPPTPAADATG